MGRFHEYLQRRRDFSSVYVCTCHQRVRAAWYLSRGEEFEAVYIRVRLALMQEVSLLLINGGLRRGSRRCVGRHEISPGGPIHEMRPRYIPRVLAVIMALSTRGRTALDRQMYMVTKLG